MSKKLLLILILALPLLGGCDGMRRLAGRPTTGEIDADRTARMRAAEAVHQRRIDSLAKVEAQMADSLAQLDTLRQLRGTILNPSRLGGLFTTKLDFRYYIVVGAFTQRYNAEHLMETTKARGYNTTIINFRNGYNAVGVCPSNDLNSVNAALRKVKLEPFCPNDVWILVNE